MRLERKRVKDRVEIRSCLLCRTSFKATRTWQVYCSSSCKNGHHAQLALEEKVARDAKIEQLEDQLEKAENRIVELLQRISILEK